MELEIRGEIRVISRSLEQIGSLKWCLIRCLRNAPCSVPGRDHQPGLSCLSFGCWSFSPHWKRMFPLFSAHLRCLRMQTLLSPRRRSDGQGCVGGYVQRVIVLALMVFLANYGVRITAFSLLRSLQMIPTLCLCCAARSGLLETFFPRLGERGCTALFAAW